MKKENTRKNLIPPSVYRISEMTQMIVKETPIGTNLGLYDGLMTMMGGHLLSSRGALVPALDQAGLERARVKRSWQAMAHGAWDVNELLKELHEEVIAEGRWQAMTVDGYRVKALDTVGFFRPKLKGCRTKHYDSQANRALPAMGFGILADIGKVGEQPVSMSRQIVRATGRASSEEGLMAHLARETSALLNEQDLTTADRKFSPLKMLHGGHKRLVLRRPKNMTMRRAAPPAYKGVGRKPTRGDVVRPLPRTHDGKLIPATPPDAAQQWKHTEVKDGQPREITLHAKVWSNLRLPPQKNWTKTETQLAQRTAWTVITVKHPDFKEPLVILLNMDLSPQHAYQVVRGRWGIEQPPLIAKQLLGTHRQFVHAKDMCFRLPELSLLAAGILVHVAATQPAQPTGWWDRHPQPTAGRLRRRLSKVGFLDLPRLDQLREKHSRTDHLPTGFNAALAARRTRRGNVSEN